MNRDLDYVMFTPEQLHARVQEIGRQLTEEYAGKAPILLCIMKGSLVFTADLMREINLPCTLEYLTLSSYRAMATTPGALDMKEPFDLDINGRDIIVIEDILDTGRTLSFVMKLLGKQSPPPSSWWCCWISPAAGKHQWRPTLWALASPMPLWWAMVWTMTRNIGTCPVSACSSPASTRDRNTVIARE